MGGRVVARWGETVRRPIAVRRSGLLRPVMSWSNGRVPTIFAALVTIVIPCPRRTDRHERLGRTPGRR